MTRPQRDQAVRCFMSKDKARVMLMSLKCGGEWSLPFAKRKLDTTISPGVGLNLTRANNVISLDLGWSQAVEAQAFDRFVLNSLSLLPSKSKLVLFRVHRLGQTRPVVVQRLVISDTVEDRILALQERKVNDLEQCHSLCLKYRDSNFSLTEVLGRELQRRLVVGFLFSSTLMLISPFRTV
jgi:hypothetical protein